MSKYLAYSYKINYITKNEWATINLREEDQAMPNFVREKFNDINIVLEILNKN